MYFKYMLYYFYVRLLVGVSVTLLYSIGPDLPNHLKWRILVMLRVTPIFQTVFYLMVSSDPIFHFYEG